MRSEFSFFAFVFNRLKGRTHSMDEMQNAFNIRCDYNPRICREQMIVQYVWVFIRFREIEEQMNLRRALKELQEQRSKYT